VPGVAIMAAHGTHHHGMYGGSVSALWHIWSLIPIPPFFFGRFGRLVFMYLHNLHIYPIYLTASHFLKCAGKCVVNTVDLDHHNQASGSNTKNEFFGELQAMLYITQFTLHNPIGRFTLGCVTMFKPIFNTLNA
jgi:hypothetical protein